LLNSHSVEPLRASSPSPHLLPRVNSGSIAPAQSFGRPDGR
jgi:hypothetical protein